jgi:hypothetical protein
MATRSQVVVWRPFVGGLVLLLLLSATASAEMPPHLVLHRPGATAYASPYSKAVLVPAQPYPYGYFGAACTWPQWRRQLGINRTYTQWSQK